MVWISEYGYGQKRKIRMIIMNCGMKVEWGQDKNRTDEVESENWRKNQSRVRARHK